jgi:hypothetical protein
MPSREMPSFTKSPAALQEAFRAALDRFPDAERRQMFGYPAAFANGNMWTSLFQDRWVVRLPPDARDELLAIPGASSFEPMPGRPMTGFSVLPDSVLADDAARSAWLDRAWTHALTMPPKAAKAPATRTPKPTA